MSAGPGHFAVLSAIVFAIGLYGVISREDTLGELMALVVLLTAPLIALVGFAQTGKGGSVPPFGNAFAVLALLCTLAEVAAASGVAMLVWRRLQSSQLDDLVDVDVN